MAVATMPPPVYTDVPPTEQERPYEPLGAHWEAATARDRIVVLEGPADTGKSRCVFEKLHAVCEKYAGARCLYVRNTRESCSESGLVTYENKVLPAGHPARTDVQRSQRKLYKYPNGSELVVGGLDKPEKLFSTEYDIVFIQECNEIDVEETADAFMRCLRNEKVPYQQLLMDLNPTSELFWLYEWETTGKARFITFTHADNPSITESRLANLRSLKGSLYDRLYLGKRVAAVEGAYYGQLLYEARKDGRIGSVPYNPKYSVHVAFDLGIYDYTAVWWFQVDPQGRWFIIDYLEHRGEGMGYYSEVLQDRARERRFTYGLVILPHDGKNGLQAETVVNRVDIMRGYGYNVVAIDDPLNDDMQIEGVRQMLPLAHIDAERCRKGIQRLTAFKQDKNIRTGIYGKPVHDEASHAAKSLAYAVMGYRPPTTGGEQWDDSGWGM